MIFYFSATGNSRYVAKRLAQLNQDTLFEIGCHESRTYRIMDGESIGFVMPTYYWGVPKVVLDFIKTMNVDGSHYCYLVLTCGGSTSRAAAIFRKAFDSRFAPVNTVQGFYSVKMPDTYTPMFDIPDAQRSAEIVKESDPVIEEVAEHVKKQSVGDFDQLHGKAILTTVCYPIYKIITTRLFHVTDACVGCGLCETNCPSHAIKMVEGKPQWVLRQCSHCLRCLHRCPQFAIQFGKSTSKRGQYINPAIE